MLSYHQFNLHAQVHKQVKNPLVFPWPDPMNPRQNLHTPVACSRLASILMLPGTTWYFVDRIWPAPRSGVERWRGQDKDNGRASYGGLFKAVFIQAISSLISPYLYGFVIDITGARVIDPSLHVPDAYLSPLNSREERKNLHLHMRDGSVDVRRGHKWGSYQEKHAMT